MGHFPHRFRAAAAPVLLARKTDANAAAAPLAGLAVDWKRRSPEVLAAVDHLSGGRDGVRAMLVPPGARARRRQVAGRELGSATCGAGSPTT